jgi:Flp pilus assembly protein TadB
VLSSRRSQVGEEKKKAKKRKKSLIGKQKKDKKKRNRVRRHSGTRWLIVPLSVDRSRPTLSSLFVPRFRSVCVSVFGLVCIIMARWWLFSINLVITTFFIIVTFNAERNHHDSIIQLLKDPEQLQIIHAMLKNYKG